MVKKVIIVILICVALFVVIFQPGELSVAIGGMAEEVQESGGNIFTVILFYIIFFCCVASTLLFWIGVPAGWNFARDRDWGLVAILISTYIGMILSFPIALYQLFRSE